MSSSCWWNITGKVMSAVKAQKRNTKDFLLALNMKLHESRTKQ